MRPPQIILSGGNGPVGEDDLDLSRAPGGGQVGHERGPPSSVFAGKGAEQLGRRKKKGER